MTRRWFARGFLAAAIAASTLAACTAPVPPPTAGLATPGTTLPTPPGTTLPVPTASLVPPVVTCYTDARPTTLTCDRAIAAALLALPAGHPPIRRIEFHWGRYCPPAAFCPVELWPPNSGYVVFRAADRADRQLDLFVNVLADATGTVSVVGTAGPFPPSHSNLPTHRQMEAAPAARMEGRLALAGQCLIVVGDHGQRWLAIWPPDFRLDGTALIGSSGRRIAYVGEAISMAGGEYHETQWDFLDRLLATPVPSGCRLGTYWLANDVRKNG